MLIPFGVFSAGAGVSNSYELISTTLISTNTASVTFDVTGLGSTYKHLQIRFTARQSAAQSMSGINTNVNGDTAANYSMHRLYGTGSSVSSDAPGTPNNSNFQISGIAAANDTASAFSVAVFDILDAFNTNKYKTFRSLSGGANGASQIYLNSGNWRNTAAITTIAFTPQGTNFVAGSRFSLYGIRG